MHGRRMITYDVHLESRQQLCTAHAGDALKTHINPIDGRWIDRGEYTWVEV